MLIPIFGSCPTHLSKKQDDVKRLLLGELGHAGLEWRSIGQTDYPTSCPLREVFFLAKHCSGGVVLGFSQFSTTSGTWKKGTPFEKRQSDKASFPTPWNHLETGILFSLGLPCLVFREPGISGGVFDNGVSDLFIHEMPNPRMPRSKRIALSQIVRKFAADVHGQYYGK